MNSFFARLFACALAAVVVQFGGASSAVRASNAPVRLVAILSLSGIYAGAGGMQRRALVTATRVVNQQGGVNGRPLQLDLYDDHSNIDSAIQLAHAVLDESGVAAIVGGTFSGTCEAIRAETERAGMVQYCLSGAERPGGTFFSSFPRASQLFGEQPLAFLRRQGARRIAVITSESGTGAIYAHVMRGAMEHAGLAPVVSAIVSGQSKVRRAVDRAHAAHADAVYLGTNDSDSVLVLRAMQSRAWQAPVWVANAASRADARTLLAPYLPPGPVYTAGDAVDVAEQLPAESEQRQALLAYLRTFEQDHGTRPDLYATVAADAMEFLVAALRADGEVGGPLLARTLEATPAVTALYSSYHFSTRRHGGADLSGVIVRYQRDGSRSYVGTAVQ
jgi:branched-chain amino acid transport system substrate-binding protein